MKYDMLIKGGQVIDVTDQSDLYRPWTILDIGIKGERIVAVGHLDSSEAANVIDASGLAVSAGFIDVHTHSDTYLLVNPKAESKIRQGVTTEVIGSCGLSAAPIGNSYIPQKSILSDCVAYEWSTMDEYLKRLEEMKTSVNVVPLVGHNNIRGSVMGYDTRHASEQQMHHMGELLEEAFDAGVWGMSSGLNMPPGASTETDELIALCSMVARQGGVYHTHIRGQGDRLLTAVTEAIETAKQSGVPLHIHHHKGMGDANAPKVEHTLAMFDEEISCGRDVTLDLYPYLAGQGGLGMFLPIWVHEGGISSLIKRLQDPKLRKIIKRQMVEPELLTGYQSYTRELGITKCWDHILICDITSEQNQYAVGKTIGEILPRDKDPLDFIFDLLIQEQGDVPVVIPDLIDMDDRYFQMVLQYPNTMFGSDGYTLAAEGPLSRGNPHPRSYGTFPRILGTYVRNKRWFSLKEAIRKMTYLPAVHLGIKDRGLLKEGMYADVVIFNPETVIDQSTFSNPHQYPLGIEYVIVNGSLTIEKGEHSGALNGKILRKGQ